MEIEFTLPACLFQLADDGFGKLTGLAGRGERHPIDFGGNGPFGLCKCAHPRFQRVAAPQADVDLGGMARQFGGVCRFRDEFAVHIPADAILLPHEGIIR